MGEAGAQKPRDDSLRLRYQTELPKLDLNEHGLQQHILNQYSSTSTTNNGSKKMVQVEDTYKLQTHRLVSNKSNN